MSHLLLWVLRVALAWFGLALPVGIGIGRAIRTADTAQASEPEAPQWSGTAEDLAFVHLIPEFATEELTSLLEHMDRRAGGVV